MTANDLNGLTVRELMVLDGQVIQELKNRNVVRGNNKPIGDVAEYLVWKVRGGELLSNSSKSSDVVDKTGRRIQVKARAMTGLSGQFSTFRSFDFDTVILVVFDPKTFSISWARELSSQELESVAFHYKWVNGFTVTPKSVDNLGMDVREELSNVFKLLR